MHVWVTQATEAAEWAVQYGSSRGGVAGASIKLKPNNFIQQ
jgi:hypothetical protein